MSTLEAVQPTEEQAWERQLSEAARASDESQWQIGDLIRGANEEWGDTYTRAVAITGKSEKTLKNYVWVCSKFEKSRRRDQLTFGHHAAVGGLDEPQQESMLDKAQKSSWPVAALEMKVRAASSKTPETDPADRVVVMVPRGSYPSFLDAAEARQFSPDEKKMKQTVAAWLLGLGQREVASTEQAAQGEVVAWASRLRRARSLASDRVGRAQSGSFFGCVLTRESVAQIALCSADDLG